MNGLALCAGAGGLELGVQIAEPGYRTVCFVEREAYAAAALVARMEDEALDQAPVWDDVKSFDGRPWRGLVDIVTAGYPCQPFSAAGHRLGAQDPRHLWPDVARIVDEVHPRLVFLENVANHLRLGFPEVAGDLRGMGYGVLAGLFTAREVGAAQIRRRLFVLAHADGAEHGNLAGAVDRSGGLPVRRNAERISVRAGSVGAGLVGAVGFTELVDRHAGDQVASSEPALFAPGPGDFETWRCLLEECPGLEPTLLRAADGMADRLDRQRLAGNGVVPLAAALAYRTLRADFDAALAA